MTAALKSLLAVWKEKQTLTKLQENLWIYYKMDSIDPMNCKSVRDTKNTTLINIITSSRDDEAFRILNSGKTFSQEELDNALIVACNCKFKLLIYKLIHLGADIQTEDASGNTPLLICAEQHSTNVVRFLLSRKVNINAENDYGDTALILAIHQTGSVELVKLLLSQKGMNVNHQNKSGYTALMKAIQCKDIEVIKLLLDSQENAVKALDEIHNCRNETAQNIADKLRKPVITELLLKNRVKERSQILAAIQACDMIYFNKMLDRLMSDTRNTLSIVNDAFMAIFMAHEQSGVTFNEDEETMIQRLLECFADVNGCSYLFFPVHIATKVGSYNVLEILLQHGARLSKLAMFWVRSNPLKIAVENGRNDLVELLLRSHSKLFVPRFGYPAVECALRNGHTRCAWLLVQHGAIMHVKYALSVPIHNTVPIYFMKLKDKSRPEISQTVATHDARGLIICAESRENIEMTGVSMPGEAVKDYIHEARKDSLNKSSKLIILNFLIQRHEDLNKYHATYRDHNSPIVRFLAHCNFDLRTKEVSLESMVKCYYHVNKKSFGGRTPLMVAVSNGESLNIVEMLLKHGAEVDAIDSKGNTVLLLAVEKNITSNALCVLQYSYSYHRTILDYPNRKGLTPLMIATENHNYRIMEALILCNANVNAKDVNGNTALLFAVSRYSQELQILRSFINIESHVAWQNTADISAYLVTGEASLKMAITLLVSSGADVNAVNKKAPDETALTLLLKNSSLDDHALDCMEYLLDHGARASYATSDIIHRLIQLRKIYLIPKLILRGFGPVDITDFMILNDMLDVAITTVSPLWKALQMGNAKLARYFVRNMFMTSSDVTPLVYKDLRLLLKSSNDQECLQFLDEISTQPMSLFSLAFIAVQSAVGSEPGREDRVRRLPVPLMVVDRLLFRVLHNTMGIPDFDVSLGSVEMPNIDPVRADVPEDSDDDDDNYESYNYVAHEVDSSDDDYLFEFKDY